jgi:hypothetical protein
VSHSTRSRTEVADTVSVVMRWGFASMPEPQTFASTLERNLPLASVGMNPEVTLSVYSPVAGRASVPPPYAVSKR